MSGLNKLRKRTQNFLTGRGFMTGSERRKKKEVKRQGIKDKMFAEAHMPDEEEIARNERRKAARRRGSRVSTVLTDLDTLG